MNFIETVKRNIRRNPYQAIAASMVMFLTFLILSIFLILAYGSQQILRFYESKPQAIAFFKDGTTITDINAIKNALTQTDKITSLNMFPKKKLYRFINKGIKATLCF